VKKAARKTVRLMDPRAALAVENTVDVIEKPALGVITITEFGETEVREGLLAKVAAIALANSDASTADG